MILQLCVFNVFIHSEFAASFYLDLERLLQLLDDRLSVLQL